MILEKVNKMSMIKFLLNYWKEIAIGIIIGASVFVFTSWIEGAAEIKNLKAQIVIAGEQNANLQSKLDGYAKAEDEAKQAQKIMLENRKIIVEDLTKEINKLRSQVIPKDCQGAVNYGIKYKDDMKWPEKRSSQ